MSHAKQELQTLVHDLNPEELSVILQIEELDTLKIGENPLNQRIPEKQCKLHTTRLGVHSFIVASPNSSYVRREWE